MQTINPDLYAQNHADKASSQATVKIVVAWLVGFTTCLLYTSDAADE